MTLIVALTHTEGVILFNKYVILELAYSDILGFNAHFLIKSPMSYTVAKKYHEHLEKSLEVIMCVADSYNNHKVYRFFEVLQFLRKRYAILQRHFGNGIQFGYKGRSFQRDILVKCNIPNANIENFGIPSIKMLKLYYPFVKRRCIYHKTFYNKCAQHILRLINIHLNHSILSTP